jgi:hypothetical protein
MLTFSAISRTVKQRLERMTSLSFATISSAFDIEGRPEQGSSSVEVRPSLKRYYHSYVWVRPKFSFPNAVFNISNVSVKDFPNLTKFHTNLSLVKIAYFKQNKNRWAQVTLVHTNRRNTMTKQIIALLFTLNYFPMLSLCCSMISILLVALAGALFKELWNLPDKLVHVSYSERFPRWSYSTVQVQNCW